MSDKQFTRWIIGLGLAFFADFVVLFLMSVNYKLEPIPLLAWLLLPCIQGIMTVLSLRYMDMPKYRKVLRWIMYSALIICIPLGVLINDIFFFLGTTTVIILNIEMFIFRERRSHVYLYILIALIILGIIFKRQQWPGAGLLLTTGFVIMGLGLFVYGIKSIIQVRRNVYLKLVTAVCSFFIFMISVAIVSRFQHWPGGTYMTRISSIPVVVITIFVLTTLPLAGFINWEKKQRSNFIRILLVPWIFLLFFFATTYTIPDMDIDSLLVNKTVKKTHFDMYNYEIEEGSPEME